RGPRCRGRSSPSNPAVDQRLGPDMSISAFRETSFPSGRDKLLIGPARAGGSHGGPDALAPPELPEALDWPERVPVWESVHGPRLAVPRLEDAACQPRPDGPP